MAEEKKVSDEQMALNINLDTTPVLYTDNVLITVNPEGVVLDFCQRLGTTNQIRVVSRIGMSREHAKKFLQSFETIIAQSEGKLQTGSGKITN